MTQSLFPAASAATGNPPVAEWPASASHSLQSIADAGAAGGDWFSTEDLRRPVLRYHGGKWRLAPWVISHMPAHKCYVECFGGAAGVLLRKKRSTIEVYNDLDTQVVNYFRVLRDPELRVRLVSLLELTPFSRGEFEASYEFSPDPVEAARRFVTRCFLGHGTCSVDPDDSNGFRSCDIRAGKSYAREWAGVPDAIAAAADRLTGVTIENLDFRKLLHKFNSPETLFYLDPPYPLSTRQAGGKGYVHEMSDADHRQMAWMLRGTSAKVMISGYPCSLYDDLYSSWRRVEKKTTANGQRGAVPRTEVLWMNFPGET
ncbi:DNA adenine methylase [Luteolibacter yonseiensis]|uniref:DNA adenine methylase n=1 Tax=Luteolibacter yonseiensis TaxID=1144680 RepID=A0A934R417_9BACT|nr:DNA adenine methylase [Luteolibacter yonseiensis]MBK1816509.1 DNA adenine methylase [Luteolibacter yonseiensis]